MGWDNQTEDTSQFFLDGHKELDFVAREKPDAIDWPNFNIDPEIDWSDEVGVLILRHVCFFHAEQKITLGKLREFFTPKAIKLFEKDGYIELIINNEKKE